MRQLYNTVAIPAFTYAADVWFTPIRPSPNCNKHTGSVTIVKCLIPVQRKATKTITGALNTTASDVLDTHANLLPVDLLFDKVLFRSVVRLTSLPPSHLLHSPVQKAAKCHIN